MAKELKELRCNWLRGKGFRPDVIRDAMEWADAEHAKGCETGDHQILELAQKLQLEDVGPKGPRGEVGPEGPQGPQGAPGSTGPHGLDGQQGDTGPQGPRGETGPQGPQGPQGVEGPRGPQGLQGPAGTQGDRGPVGPQGDPIDAAIVRKLILYAVLSGCSSGIIAGALMYGFWR